MRTNLILNTDSYKASHYLQMPPNTEYQSSYIESRGGEFEKSVFFGLQAFLSEYMSSPITLGDINDAESFWNAHGEPFNREGWMYILNKHGGYLPLEIRAVPEGTVMPVRNALVQVVNTDPECFWLTSYVETAILRAVWFPTTVASLSYRCKEHIYSSLVETSDDPDGQIDFKLHDFGARGTSSMESASIGGAAHLINFRGTDTVSGVLFSNKYYGSGVSGFSIPASEHSTITSWGGPDGEIKAFSNMVDQFAKPGRLFACVSDSYDIYRAANELWPSLKEKIEGSGATLVVRPDSGNPVVVPVEVVSALGEKFGYTVNSKGYRVINPCVRVIQGDGINHHTIPEILRNLNMSGWSTDNLAFGMGGGLLQQLNRDTMQFAMKCSAIKVDGFWRDVFKDPITDNGKKSKKGILSVVRNGDGEYITLRRDELSKNSYSVDDDILAPVWRNGSVLNYQNFSSIRSRANIGFSGR